MKGKTHIIVEKRVWIVEGFRTDNKNHLYYKVWASTPDEAKAYLLHTELKGIAVTFTNHSENVNGRYEMTINCYLNQPEKYEGNLPTQADM